MTACRAAYILSGEAMQKEFAEKVKVDQYQVSKQIRGICGININTLLSICETYGFELVIRKGEEEIVIDE